MGWACPQVFLGLGVRNSSQSEGAVTSDMQIRVIDRSWEEDFLLPSRELWSCDIQLSVARLGLTGDVQIVGGMGTSGNDVVYSPRLSTQVLDYRGTRARLHSVKRFESLMIPTFIERFLGDWNDPQEDNLHVARIWLLSPPDFDGEKPDESWQPFTQHRVFWNLAYASRRVAIPDVLPPITLVTGLAAGVGDRINASMLAPINDSMQQINAALETISPEGMFWTI